MDASDKKCCVVCAYFHTTLHYINAQQRIQYFYPHHKQPVVPVERNQDALKIFLKIIMNNMTIIRYTNKEK